MRLKLYTTFADGMTYLLDGLLFAGVHRRRPACSASLHTGSFDTNVSENIALLS